MTCANSPALPEPPFSNLSSERTGLNLKSLPTLLFHFFALRTVDPTGSFFECEGSQRTITRLSINSHKARAEGRDWAGWALPREDAYYFVLNQNLRLSPQFRLISFFFFLALPRCKQLSCRFYEGKTKQNRHVAFKNSLGKL